MLQWNFHGNHVEKSTLIIGNWTSCVPHKYKQSSALFQSTNTSALNHAYTLLFFLFYILLYTCNTKWSYIHIYLYRLNNVLFLPFWSIITSLSIPFFVFKYVVFFVHFQRKIYSSPETILKVDCCQGKMKINFILKLYWKYSAFLEIIHKCFGFVKIKVKIKSHNNYVYIKIYNNIKVFWKKVLYLYLWNNPKKNWI